MNFYNIFLWLYIFLYICQQTIKQNTMKELENIIENGLDSMSKNVANEFNLKSGDVSLEWELRLETVKEDLIKLMLQLKEENK